MTSTAIVSIWFAQLRKIDLILIANNIPANPKLE